MRLPAVLLFLVGCSQARPAAGPAPAPEPAAPAGENRRAPARTEPALKPQLAFLAGLMPLRSTGSDTFRSRNPQYDGRGVLIAILDGGIDPGLPGLRATSTGQPKLLDVRDFSGEGRVELAPVEPGPDGTAVVGPHRLSGLGRVSRLAQPPYFGGVLRELPLGPLPASDLNGNGTNTDAFPAIVARSSSGWFAVTDTDGDGSLEEEVPLYDYAIAPAFFSYGIASDAGASPRMSLAVNLSEQDGRPTLDFVFDNSGHGTHVAGIAAGHGMFGVPGFDGIAPGSQLLALKIANNARGGISVTGSVLRGMNYAADYAERRGLPLIINLSYGVGNEVEGSAAIDSLVDEFILKHPGVLFVIAAGNDGPGLSTIGFPGSAELALTACALFPGAFAKAPDEDRPAPPDALGWWSARGGELAKPDVCVPGVAFSNVPPWHTGDEISAGTSMAAPQLAGLAALLQSALMQQGNRPAPAAALKRAILATARPAPGAAPLDQGTGVPNASAALRWLQQKVEAPLYRVRAIPGGETEPGNATAAYRRNGLASGQDTVQQFVIQSTGEGMPPRLRAVSDAPWLRGPASITTSGAPDTITLFYDRSALVRPGLYVGTVTLRPDREEHGEALARLINTVVVPHDLSTPLRIREQLSAGRLARYFLAVPEGAAGMTVRLSLEDRRDKATLYLFEPDGKPHRGGASVAAGDKDSVRAGITVSADDLVPGVYEAVVVAPPAAPVRYRLDAAVPRVVIEPAPAGGSGLLRMLSGQGAAVSVRTDVQGAVRDTIVVGTGGRPLLLPVAVPDWARQMVVDVELSAELWNSVTDFGVTVFDTAGQQLGHSPMSYAFARQTVELDSVRTPRATIELFPAFAHLRPPGRWTARVRVSYLAERPLASQVRALLLGSSPVRVSFPSAPADAVPEGFRPLVRLTADAGPEPPAVHQGAW